MEADDEASSTNSAGDSLYECNDNEIEDRKGKLDNRELDEECDGVSRSSILNEKIEKLLNDIDPSDLVYTSRRDLDMHIVPKTTDDDKTRYQEARAVISAKVATMTSALDQVLRSLSRCRRKPYLRQGKIDKKRLVALAKSLSKEVFYKKQDGIDLDVAVEILIDESGSMGNFRDVRLLAIAIGESLNAIGVPFEITGTSTKYSEFDKNMPKMDGFSRVNPIVYFHYKMFGDAWEAVRHRIMYTSARNHNVDGEVVEYAAFRLAGRPERRKIIFSLSDGAPCAGHNNDRIMAKNLKRVCERVRKAGIEVYGFGIDTTDPEPLYGKKWFVYLSDVNTMGVEFVRHFAAVVTGGMVKV
jgi:cobalamin biosynthesis protein CobT